MKKSNQIFGKVFAAFVFVFIVSGVFSLSFVRSVSAWEVCDEDEYGRPAPCPDEEGEGETGCPPNNPNCNPPPTEPASPSYELILRRGRTNLQIYPTLA
jgi:hypothetical protein